MKIYKQQYQDPNNPSNTWTGQGSPPKWLRKLAHEDANWPALAAKQWAKMNGCLVSESQPAQQTKVPTWMRMQHAYDGCTQDHILQLFAKFKKVMKGDTLSVKQIILGLKTEFKTVNKAHAINQALAKLIEKNRIERVGRGLYKIMA